MVLETTSLLVSDLDCPGYSFGYESLLQLDMEAKGDLEVAREVASLLMQRRGGRVSCKGLRSA